MSTHRTANKFLDEDGFINVAEFIALTRDTEKMAQQEGLKPAELFFAGKVIPKFDKARAKTGGELFVRKRAQIIKSRTRMPATGTRLKMQVLLKNFKGLDGEGFEDFYSDYKLALKAIAAHTKQAERIIERNKKEGAKKRDALAAAFDKNLDCLVNDVLPEDIDFAVGTSMMGKTVIVKLPNGGYVSIGKADKERFEKAKESEEGAEKKTAKPAAARSRRR